jgi:hypothetical protein
VEEHQQRAGTRCVARHVEPSRALADGQVAHRTDGLVAAGDGGVLDEQPASGRQREGLRGRLVRESLQPQHQLGVDRQRLTVDRQPPPGEHALDARRQAQRGTQRQGLGARLRCGEKGVPFAHTFNLMSWISKALATYSNAAPTHR